MRLQACVSGMFDMREFPAFKSHLRDFLVQTKQFASQDNAELFAEEVAAQREVALLIKSVCVTCSGSSRPCY